MPIMSGVAARVGAAVQERILPSVNRLMSKGINPAQDAREIGRAFENGPVQSTYENMREMVKARPGFEEVDHGTAYSFSRGAIDAHVINYRNPANGLSERVSYGAKNVERVVYDQDSKPLEAINFLYGGSKTGYVAQVAVPNEYGKAAEFLADGSVVEKGNVYDQFGGDTFNHGAREMGVWKSGGSGKPSTVSFVDGSTYRTDIM